METIGINDWKQKLALNRRQLSDRVLGDWKLPQVFSASDVTCFRGSQGTEKCFDWPIFHAKKSGFFTCLYWTTPTKVPLSPNPPKTKIKSERKNNKKQQWLQPFWNTNSLAGDGYPFLLRPFFWPFVEYQRVGHFSLNFFSTPGKMMPRVKCEKWNMLGVVFERFWKFWWIFVLGPSNSTVCAWHYGLRVLVFVLRDSEQKLQIIVMETVIRFGKIVVTPWRIEFIFFLRSWKAWSETRN